MATGRCERRSTAQIWWRLAAAIGVIVAMIGGPMALPVVADPGSTTTNPCNAEPPDGYAFDQSGRPHVIKTPYTPNTHYNPISLANFIHLAIGSKTLGEAERLCFAKLGAEHLIAGSTTRVYDSKTSLWLAYPFEFPANPAIEALPAGWHSGLGQAGALTALLGVATLTGEQQWDEYADQLFNSYLVPLADGGFTNRENGFLWFEEYPTNPPTSVFNGHFRAVIALTSYAKRRVGTPAGELAWKLFDEAVESLASEVSKMEVPAEGGILSSYDLVRGYPSVPLRAVPADPSKPAPTITQTLINDSISAVLPVGVQDLPAPNQLRNSGMALEDGRLEGWTTIGGNPKGVLLRDGWVGVRPSGAGWVGVEQTIPAGSFPSGAELSLSMVSRLQIPEAEEGTGGRVAVSSVCGGTKTLIHDDWKNRHRQQAWSASNFKAPSSECAINVALSTYSDQATNTTAWFTDVTLRQADRLGVALTPKYDLLVRQTPENSLVLRGEGQVRVQGWYGGRWRNIGPAVTLSDSDASVKIPELYTGRNINTKYHDGHVYELLNIAAPANARGLTEEARILDSAAYQLSRMSVGWPYTTKFVPRASPRPIRLTPQ